MRAANIDSASASREVLERCEYLLMELRSEPKGIAWQAKLSATIALLRSIGHILDKRDSKANKSFETAVKQWWKALKKRKPKPEIFWQFMEDERNIILKYGELRAGQSVSITGQTVSVSITLLGAAATALAGDQVAPPPPPKKSPEATYSYHMNDGPFCGRDPHDLVAEAIVWWRKELESIEKAASSAGP